jgi:putative ABC transport system permease protein
MLIALFVKHELSYDSFHENADNIYRVNLRYNIGVNKFDEALGPVPLAEAMKEDFPEVLHSTRLYHTNYRGWIVYVKYGDKQFRE